MPERQQRGKMLNINDCRKNIPARLNPEHRDFANGEWCYDSPGEQNSSMRSSKTTRKYNSG
jgi:hypothetical protein